MPGRRTSDAQTNLMAMLATIQGSPNYWTNIVSPVTNRLIVPSSKLIQMPYLSVVQVQDAPTYDEQDGDHIRQRWKLRIFGYVEDTSSDAGFSSGPSAISDLRDDVMRVLLTDWTLKGAVDNLEVIPSDGASGGVLGGWAEFEILLECWSYLSPEGLGP